ncbi:hypothetical protein RDV84_12840 [Lysobacter yananisis]|uniref:DUF2254 domain-containing protein n=1 Tax=Lysobacter yananisis TaxID=1003114 RepID=A0ABY9PFM5_9GAMM|nr:hypothetical protein [Lysobacter yananisis]WMT05686.1 hypothetical protein RDV84_12840 [Lysobacter yananisis]
MRKPELSKRYDAMTAAIRKSWGELVQHSKKYARLKKAELVRTRYVQRDRLIDLASRKMWVARAVIFLLAASATALVAEPLQVRVIETYLTTKDDLAAIKSLFLNVGSASIGAAAIAFSIVLFAIQINVERMPQGLFRRLSSDRRLLGSFFFSFVVAVAITFLSLIPSAKYASAALLAMCWGIGTMLGLFLYAYRRALSLINPIEQLKIVQSVVRNDLLAWGKRALRMGPLFELDPETQRRESQYDYARLSFFNDHPHWTRLAEDGVRTAVSYSRQYAQSGDYEVSQFAILSIVKINGAYVAAKGRTFFAHNGFIDEPRATDGFINSTLEQVKQSFQLALSRRDEQHINQTIRTFTGLAAVYTFIDYPQEGASRHHTNLAVGYLKSALEEVARQNLPDVMMLGARGLGDVARAVLARAPSDQIRGIVERIGVIAAIGALNSNQRPVTQTAMEQLADLILQVLQRQQEIESTLEKIALAAYGAATIFSTSPEDLRSHSDYLSPYFSTAQLSSLPTGINLLVNAAIAAPADHEHAPTIIRNLYTLLKVSRRPHKDLLIHTIGQRSSLAFDMLHGTTDAMEILLALAGGPACPQNLVEAMRDEADRYASILTWIRFDDGVANFLESHSYTELLFRAGATAQDRDGTDAYETVRDLLLNWGIEGGRLARGWATFEQAMFALCALAVRSGSQHEAEWLIRRLTERHEDLLLYELDERVGIARALRDRAHRLRARAYELNDIDRQLGAGDRNATGHLLEQIAASLGADGGA